MKQPKVASDKSETIAQLPAACHDETAAVEFMERQRWETEPRCPYCGFTTVYQMRDRATGERSKRFLWRCLNCKQQYSVRKATVFEDSRIPLRHWCYAFWAACASKKGVSALQIKRMTGLSYKSALFMMHRIRFAMANGHEMEPMLDGTVEADETYVGGKPRYRGPHNNPLKGKKHKPAVFAMVERGGRARAMVMPEVSGANLKRELRNHVFYTARLITDESNWYANPDREYYGGHHTVNHSAKEYVRGDIYTNTVEGFFSLLKRGLIGTFHSVSKKHLHRYVAEFEYRYNTRAMEDGARTSQAIRQAVGKRLLYREPTAS